MLEFFLRIEHLKAFIYLFYLTQSFLLIRLKLRQAL